MDCPLHPDTELRYCGWSTRERDQRFYCPLCKRDWYLADIRRREKAAQGYTTPHQRIDEHLAAIDEWEE